MNFEKNIIKSDESEELLEDFKIEESHEENKLSFTEDDLKNSLVEDSHESGDLVSERVHSESTLSNGGSNLEQKEVKEKIKKIYEELEENDKRDFVTPESRGKKEKMEKELHILEEKTVLNGRGLSKDVHREVRRNKSQEEAKRIPLEERREESKKRSLNEIEKNLGDSREKLAHEYAFLKEKTLGFFGSEKIQDEEKAYKVALIENEYRKNLSEYRKFLLKDNPLGIKEDENKVRSLVVKSVILEIDKFDDLKTKFKAEAGGSIGFEKNKFIIKKAVDNYRKMPAKYKLLISASLFGAGIGASSIGGGTLALAGVLSSKGVASFFEGASVFTGVETLMKKIQKRRETKNILKNLDIDHLDSGEKKEGLFIEGITNLLQDKNSKLDSKLFEMVGKRNGKEKQRLIISGMLGALVGVFPG